VHWVVSTPVQDEQGAVQGAHDDNPFEKEPEGQYEKQLPLNKEKPS